jgi:four helix bundle protein
MDQSIQKSKELQERMLNFAASVVGLSEQLKHKSVADQMIRSASSIGAHYSEALNASSKTDFRNKIYIAKKEAAETEYWLQLVAKISDRDTTELQGECHAILMILQKIVNTINDQRSRKDP